MVRCSANQVTKYIIETTHKTRQKQMAAVHTEIRIIWGSYCKEANRSSKTMTGETAWTRSTAVPGVPISGTLALLMPRCATVRFATQGRCPHINVTSEVGTDSDKHREGTRISRSIQRAQSELTFSVVYCLTISSKAPSIGPHPAPAGTYGCATDQSVLVPNDAPKLYLLRTLSSYSTFPVLFECYGQSHRYG
jgi:hypothetical protein